MCLPTHHGEHNNRSTDRYGEKLVILRRVAIEIRWNVPNDFIGGIKGNSADFVDRKVVVTSDEKVL